MYRGRRRRANRIKRENTRDLLEKEISTREAKRQNEENKALRMKSGATGPPSPHRRLCSTDGRGAAPVFSKISKYAWDQGKKFVVYVTLKGIEGAGRSIVFDAQATMCQRQGCRRRAR